MMYNNLRLKLIIFCFEVIWWNFIRVDRLASHFFYFYLRTIFWCILLWMSINVDAIYVLLYLFYNIRLAGVYFISWKVLFLKSITFEYILIFIFYLRKRLLWLFINSFLIFQSFLYVFNLLIDLFNLVNLIWTNLWQLRLNRIVTILQWKVFQHRLFWIIISVLFILLSLFANQLTRLFINKTWLICFYKLI
jgi:hypothetical protein